MVFKVSFQEKEKQKNWLGICALAALGLTSFNSFLLILFYGSSVKIAHKPVPRLVELPSGNTILVKPIGSKERQPETIKRFTKNILSLMFTWTGHIEVVGKNAKTTVRDPGVNLAGKPNSLLPTAAWESTLAIDANFRQDFLKYLSEIIPSEQIFNDRFDTVFVPLDISEPIALEAGYWQVNIVANILVISSNKTEKIIPFNKKVFVKAVEIPEYKGIPMNEAHSSIVGIVAAIRLSGLEIDRIEDLK